MLKCAQSNPQNGWPNSDTGRAVKAVKFSVNAAFVYELADDRYDRTTGVILKRDKYETCTEVIVALLYGKRRIFTVCGEVASAFVRHDRGIDLIHRLG